MKSAPAAMRPEAVELAREYERWAAPRRAPGGWVTPFFVWVMEVRK